MENAINDLQWYFQKSYECWQMCIVAQQYTSNIQYTLKMDILWCCELFRIMFFTTCLWTFELYYIYINVGILKNIMHSWNVNDPWILIWTLSCLFNIIICLFRVILNYQNIYCIYLSEHLFHVFSSNFCNSNIDWLHKV